MFLLSVDPLHTAGIMKYLRGVSGHWRHIGTNLHLSEGHTTIILLNHPGDPEGCMREAVVAWLSLDYDTETFGKPTWRDLADSIKTVDRALFLRIANEHFNFDMVDNTRTPGKLVMEGHAIYETATQHVKTVKDSTLACIKLCRGFG